MTPTEPARTASVVAAFPHIAGTLIHYGTLRFKPPGAVFHRNSCLNTTNAKHAFANIAGFHANNAGYVFDETIVMLGAYFLHAFPKAEWNALIFKFHVCGNE
jgi:hypothetical protein